jgi:hypothetical protein
MGAARYRTLRHPPKITPRSAPCLMNWTPALSSACRMREMFVARACDISPPSKVLTVAVDNSDRLASSACDHFSPALAAPHCAGVIIPSPTRARQHNRRGIPYMHPSYADHCEPIPLAIRGQTATAFVEHTTGDTTPHSAPLRPHGHPSSEI